MAKSVRYADLISRLSELRRHMLPRYLPTGAYSDRSFDRTRGFRLLAHAEVEAYLEDVCEDFAVRVCAAWVIDKRPRKSVASLVATLEEVRTAKRLKQPNGLVALAPSALGITSRSVKKALNVYTGSVVGGNNGVKERNVLSLTCRIGFVRSDFDPVWLGLIDTFGSNRGETAHTSGRTQTPPDPRSESQMVTLVVRGLRLLDKELQKDR